MNSEWKKGIISDFALIKGGKRLPKGVNLITTPNSHPYIRVRDLNNQRTLELNSDFEYVDDITQKSISNYIVEKNDIILSIVGTVGLTAKIGESLDKANLTENCVKLTKIKNIDTDFLFYYLRSSLGQNEIQKGTVGAVQAKLPIKNIQAIPIFYPSLIEQKRIANILSSIDEKISVNNQINNNLEEQAKVIFSKMTSNRGNNGFLSDVANITMGQSPSGSSYNEEKIGTIFFQGRAEFGSRFPSQRLYTTEPKRMAQENDVLISVRAPVGDLNIAYKDCCIGRGLAAIHSKDNHQSFIYYTMQSLKKVLDVFNNEGTVFGSINKDSLNSLPIYIPIKNDLDEFEELVAPIDNKIRINYSENLSLIALRELLLPKLMSGELDVSEIEF